MLGCFEAKTGLLILQHPQTLVLLRPRVHLCCIGHVKAWYCLTALCQSTILQRLYQSINPASAPNTCCLTTLLSCMLQLTCHVTLPQVSGGAQCRVAAMDRYLFDHGPLVQDVAGLPCRSPFVKMLFRLFTLLSHLSSWTTRCQTRNATVSFLTLRLEQELAPELLVVLIEPSPHGGLVNFPLLDLEGASLIRFGGNKEILEVLVWLLDLLLVGTHEPDSWNHTRCQLVVLKLEKQTLLSGQGILDLLDVVTRTPDLDKVLPDLDCVQSCQLALLVLAKLRFSGGTTSEIGLMFATLGMRKVGAIVLVNCETESTLEAADVVLEDIGVLVEVDGFEREFAKTLTAVGVGGGL